MLNFKLLKQKENEWIETSLNGKPLLTTPQLNKGTAFTTEERKLFGLTGKLPVHVETLEEQVERAYIQFQSYKSNLNRNIYLNQLHDTNQVLFYKLVSKHLDEMMPTIYTPIVGTAVKQYSREFRQARGLYIAYPEQDCIEEILDNRSNPEIDLIVVTDGEGVLGIGDQGIGGMDIPVAKIMVYTLCGGINHLRTLPIFLDVGTNNKELINDPLYLGWRHERIRGKEYDAFIEKFVTAVQKKFPDIFLHWEDFGRGTAKHNLDLFRERISTFNDDIQGTAAVAVAAFLTAIKVTKISLTEQRIVIFGGGTAGMGIAEHIKLAMINQGIDEKIANDKFWIVDRNGLLTQDMEDLTPAQQPFARNKTETNKWESFSKDKINLADVIHNIKPTVLIGSSAVSGAFTESVIKEMAAHVKHPIIFPLSNPTEQCEATPEDIISWTEGKALIATGSPFEPVKYQSKLIPIAQCNNALAFPGMGLGVIAVKAQRMTQEMIAATSIALSECSKYTKESPRLLPPLNEARKVARHIAIAVSNKAREQKLATITQGKVEDLIDDYVWEPHYVPFKLNQ